MGRPDARERRELTVSELMSDLSRFLDAAARGAHYTVVDGSGRSLFEIDRRGIRIATESASLLLRALFGPPSEPDGP